MRVVACYQYQNVPPAEIPDGNYRGRWDGVLCRFTVAEAHFEVVTSGQEPGEWRYCFVRVRGGDIEIK